jgi:DNA-binding HxlR family transcriptional regulator
MKKSGANLVALPTFVKILTKKCGTNFLESALKINRLSQMPDFIYNGKVYYNPVQLVMEQIGGVWKMPILWRLKDQTMRYSELRKIPHISDKMLTSQLRELEADGYVHREVFAVVPPRTEYSLTEKGREVIPLVEQIRAYGTKLMGGE